MKPLSTMNVIPFIDIMLVLLAVVLTTATFVAQGKIPIALPSAEGAHPLKVTGAVEITVAVDGAVHVADKPVTAAELPAVISSIDKASKVLLRVDERSAFRYFVRVVDLLKMNGLTNVSIVTKRSS